MIILITIISHQLGCALQSKWCCVSSGFPDYQKKKNWNPASFPENQRNLCVCVCVVVVVVVGVSFFPGAKQNDEKSTRTTTQQTKKKVWVVMPPPGPPPSKKKKKKCGSEDTCVHRTFTHTDSHSEPSKREREREKKRARFLFVFYLIFWTFVLRPTNTRGRKKNATLPLEGRQLAGLARALERERERDSEREKRGRSVRQ